LFSGSKTSGFGSSGFGSLGYGSAIAGRPLVPKAATKVTAVGAGKEVAASFPFRVGVLQRRLPLAPKGILKPVSIRFSGTPTEDKLPESSKALIAKSAVPSLPSSRKAVNFGAASASSSSANATPKEVAVTKAKLPTGM